MLAEVRLRQHDRWSGFNKPYPLAFLQINLSK